MSFTIPLIKKPFYKESYVKSQLAKFVTESDMFSMGEQCRSFEQQFAEYQGRKYAVLYNSGSSANLALTQSLINLGRLKQQDVMGFSSIGWPTTITPALQFGLDSVPVDIDHAFLNTTTKQVEHADSVLKKNYNKRISALFYTNILGGTGDIKAIAEYCNKEQIILLEDNCESLGSEYQGVKLGNFGLASTFSFFIGHHFSCIEGGAVCTDDPELADMLVMVRAHGWDRNLSEEKKHELRSEYAIDEFNAKYTFYTLGMNIRPTEITGYLGLLQLPYLPRIVEKRQENVRIFIDAISSQFDKVYNVYQNDSLTVNSNFAFPLVFRTKELFERSRTVFTEAGIEIRPIIGGNLVAQPFYRPFHKYDIPIPNTEEICSHGFYFGNNPDLTKKELDYITSILKKI